MNSEREHLKKRLYEIELLEKQYKKKQETTNNPMMIESMLMRLEMSKERILKKLTELR